MFVDNIFSDYCKQYVNNIYFYLFSPLRQVMVLYFVIGNIIY